VLLSSIAPHGNERYHTRRFKFLGSLCCRLSCLRFGLKGRKVLGRETRKALDPITPFLGVISIRGAKRKEQAWKGLDTENRYSLRRRGKFPAPLSPPSPQGGQPEQPPSEMLWTLAERERVASVFYFICLRPVASNLIKEGGIVWVKGLKGTQQGLDELEPLCAGPTLTFSEQIPSNCFDKDLSV